MANGTYGIKKPAFITYNDVEIFYYYRPNRNSESPDFSEFKALEPSSVFTQCYCNNGEILPGMYDLKLPADTFGEKGIYTIYIKPKEIRTSIVDVSTLTGNYSNIRGIVLDNSNIGGLANGDLVGYRVEYFNDGERLSDYRIITSNNLCEPVAQNMNSTTQKGIRYRFNNSSTLMFCTLTPTTAMSFKQNSLPNIGATGQEIRLVNTKFNPVAIEIEMVDHDEETLATMLEGDQIRNLNNGIITTFDKDGNVYHQARYGNITNVAEGLNSDFKITYRNSYISGEKDDYETIKDKTYNG